MEQPRVNYQLWGADYEHFTFSFKGRGQKAEGGRGDYFCLYD